MELKDIINGKEVKELIDIFDLDVSEYEIEYDYEIVDENVNEYDEYEPFIYKGMEGLFLGLFDVDITTFFVNKKGNYELVYAVYGNKLYVRKNYNRKFIDSLYDEGIIDEWSKSSLEEMKKVAFTDLDDLKEKSGV